MPCDALKLILVHLSIPCMKFLLQYLFLLIFPVALFGQNPGSPEQELSKYIQIRSVSGSEKKAGQYLERLCESKGLFIKRYSESDSTYNFCASLFPLESGKPNIVFLNHIDVVGIDDDNEWKYPPYEGKIVDDTIWGRGTLDMKGLAIMQLFAIEKIKKEFLKDEAEKLPYNVSLLCLSGEETGGRNGAALVIDNYLQTLNPAVVLGEGGTGIKGVVPGKPEQMLFFVSVAEKKSLWIQLETKLRGHGHGSMPSNKSANKVMLHTLSKLESSEPAIKFDKTTKHMFRKFGEITGGYKGYVLKHISWLVFKPIRRKILSQNEMLMAMVTNTFTLTKIYNPPGAVNQISGQSMAYYDCRLLPRFNEKPITIKRLMHVLDPRVKLQVIDESPEAMPTKPDKYYDKIEEALKSVNPGAEAIPILFLASSDNSYFRAKGIPTYGLIPAELNQELLETVHGANERIPVKALYKGIDFYSAFLKSVNTGTFLKREAKQVQRD